MNKEMTVQEIMTEPVTVANINNKFSQVMDFFSLFNIRHLPVTDNDKVIGIISLKDVFILLHEKLKSGESFSMATMDESFKVSDIMTPSPVTIEPSAGVDEALRILSRGEFHAMPVVENGLLKGIISQQDLVTVFNKDVNPPFNHFSAGAPGFAV